MHVLVLFASIEGQTRKIANHLCDWLARQGHSFDLADINDKTPPPDMKGVQAVFILAPVHAGAFPRPLQRYVKQNKQALMSVPGAFISVSLAAASDDPSEVDEVAGYIRDFSEDTGFWPVLVHHAAGALKYTEYDFFRRWMMKQISKSEGGPTDTSQDYEFTDWAALDTFAAQAVAELPQARGKI